MKTDDIQKIRDVKVLAVEKNYSILAGLLVRFEKEMIRQANESRRSATRRQGKMF